MRESLVDPEDKISDGYEYMNFAYKIDKNFGMAKRTPAYDVNCTLRNKVMLASVATSYTALYLDDGLLSNQLSRTERTRLVDKNVES
jgi:hypothetical protein